MCEITDAPGPHIIHYGIDWNVKWKDATGAERTYEFNKLLYLALDVASCPRWFIPLAPYSSAEPTDGAAPKNYRDALCGKQIAQFNEAFCGYYKRHCHTPIVCPPPDAEMARRMLSESAGSACVDLTQNCLSWSRMGECANNPGFMASECAQSCAKCQHAARAGSVTPYLGEPNATCFDEEPASTCSTLGALGACHTQLEYMQERCRRTCGYCKSSADDGSDHGSRDTAQHTCPDGTDLGGGEVMVESRGAELNALVAREDADASGTAGSHDGVASRRSGGAAGIPAAVVAVAGEDDGAATEHRQLAESLPQGHRTALDVSLTSWPFLLVQGLVLVLIGYMLRGYLDRRAKRRHRLPGAAMPART